MTKEEIEKCKDPVYFYENYMTVEGERVVLNARQKAQMRALHKARIEEKELIIIKTRGRR